MKLIDMNRKFLLISFILFTFISQSKISFSDFAAVPFEEGARWGACFSPAPKGKLKCTDMLVDIINSATSEIQVQAYSFTSQPIADALIAAAERGVNVQVILDRGQSQSRYSQKNPLAGTKVKVYIDKPSRLAHNKVFILDKKITVTGSFNLSKSAQFGNTENLIAIEDRVLAQHYYKNWLRRYTHHKILRQRATRNGGYTVTTPNGKKAASRLSDLKSPEFSRKRRTMNEENKEDVAPQPKKEESAAKRVAIRGPQERASENKKPTAGGAAKRGKTFSPCTPVRNGGFKRNPALSPIHFNFEGFGTALDDEASVSEETPQSAAQMALQAALEACGK